jgi:hypothetical protein
MFRFNRVQWSPVEESYLKEHRADNENQLTIALAKSRAAIKRKLDEFDGKPQTKKMNKRSVIGKRLDLGQFCRSGWEANCLRWLNKTNREWKYEPKIFHFEGIKHGTTSYLPDIYLPKEDIYIEVKGMLDTKSKVALRRFKKYYPDEWKKLRGIVGRRGTAADKFFAAEGIPILAYYNELDREWRGTLEHWE